MAKNLRMLVIDNEETTLKQLAALINERHTKGLCYKTGMYGCGYYWRIESKPSGGVPSADFVTSLAGAFHEADSQKLLGGLYSTLDHRKVTWEAKKAEDVVFIINAVIPYLDHDVIWSEFKRVRDSINKYVESGKYSFQKLLKEAPQNASPLTRWRIASRMSQAALAKKLGVSAPTLSLLERNKITLRDGIYSKLDIEMGPELAKDMRKWAENPTKFTGYKKPNRYISEGIALAQLMVPEAEPREQLGKYLECPKERIEALLYGASFSRKEAENLCVILYDKIDVEKIEAILKSALE